MSTDQTTAPPRPLHLPQKLRRRGWHNKQPGSLRHRIYATVRSGSRISLPLLLMNLTGHEWGGTYDPPKGRDLYFRAEGDKRFRTTDQFREMHASNRDGEWRSFNIQNDGFELHIGYVDSETGNVRGAQLSRPEVLLLVRWLLVEYFARGEWFGLRRWTYYRALSAHVAGFRRNAGRSHR